METDGAAVEVDAAFDDDEAKACAGDFADVGTAIECFEQVGDVLFGDADALILHGEDGVAAVALCREEDGGVLG